MVSQGGGSASGSAELLSGSFTVDAPDKVGLGEQPYGFLLSLINRKKLRPGEHHWRFFTQTIREIPPGPDSEIEQILPEPDESLAETLPPYTETGLGPFNGKDGRIFLPPTKVNVVGRYHLLVHVWLVVNPVQSSRASVEVSKTFRTKSFDVEENIDISQIKLSKDTGHIRLSKLLLTCLHSRKEREEISKG